MSNFLETHKPNFAKVLEHLKTELSSLRTGRAHPSIVENIIVEAYGVKTPIRGLANIIISDPRTLVVEPWDKSVIKDMEKAIQMANIGINPVNEGTKIRLSMPQMTEENRKEMIKIMGQKLEQSRISLRSVRETVKDEIAKAEKDKKIAEDEKFRATEELEKFVKEQNDEIKAIGDKKEQELMTI
jgi:ribosome recycling factor